MRCPIWMEGDSHRGTLIVHRSVEGIYRNGCVELLEAVPDMQEARVIVTFIPARTSVDLRERGIVASQAADLRARLQPFTGDWEQPEMDTYDEL